MKNISQITKVTKEVSEQYPIKKVQLFGSYADNSATDNSDIDFLVEFDSDNVSLFTISSLKISMEEKLGVSVDIVHAPIPEESIIEVGKVVDVYEA